jgi:hypothetical protein
LLAANGDDDPFLRHACVMGLAGIGQAEPLAELAKNTSAAVRSS